MRTVAIWTFGLLAFGVAGALVGGELGSVNGAPFGCIAGLSGFACLRLWAAARDQ